MRPAREANWLLWTEMAPTGEKLRDEQGGSRTLTCKTQRAQGWRVWWQSSGTAAGSGSTWALLHCQVPAGHPWVVSQPLHLCASHSRFRLEEEEGWPNLLPKSAPWPIERRQDIQVLRGLQSTQGHGSHHRSKGRGPGWRSTLKEQSSLGCFIVGWGTSSQKIYKLGNERDTLIFQCRVRAFPTCSFSTLSHGNTGLDFVCSSRIFFSVQGLECMVLFPPNLHMRRHTEPRLWDLLFVFAFLGTLSGHIFLPFLHLLSSLRISIIYLALI